MSHGQFLVLIYLQQKQKGKLGRQETKIISYVRSHETKLWQTTCMMYTNGTPCSMSFKGMQYLCTLCEPEFQKK